MLSMISSGENGSIYHRKKSFYCEKLYANNEVQRFPIYALVGLT